jgi:hypothetical protein
MSINISNTSSIVLADHQIEPIYKLTANKSEQHGLLLWYMMGTGKTLIALSYLLNFPNKHVNIICPEDLIFVWENEINKIPQIKNKINFYSFEKSAGFLNKKTYKDEIIIIDEAQHLIPVIKLKENEISSSIRLLNTSYRTLILTGTPIYNDFTDLVYLVNLASGKTTIPYNDTKFKEIYYKVNKIRSIFTGYIIPIILNINKITSNSMLLGFSLPFFYLQYTKNVKLLAKFENLPTTKFLRNNPKVLISISLLPMLANILEYIYKTLSYKIEDYKYLNVNKLVDDIHPYISYYKNKYTLNNNPFPSVNRHIKQVNYNDYQLGKWLELTQGVMNIETVKDLNITNVADFEYFSKKINMETYLNNGIVVGNLRDPKTNEFSNKFYEILKIAKGKRAVFYSNFTFNGILLFKEFLESQKINYLYLDTGLALKEKLSILNKFKNGNTFLLLHPKYTEGVSIQGSEQLHLLEPINHSAKKEQVVARVVRYQSHNHLPMSQRHVDVYQWVSGSLNPIKKMLSSISKWAKFNPEVFYTVKFNVFEQDVSPDEIIMKNEKKSSIIERDISKLLEYKNKSSKIDCCIKFPNKSQEKECLDLLKKKCN